MATFSTFATRSSAETGSTSQRWFDRNGDIQVYFLADTNDGK
jgi:hypothetical protein